jgi:hypothetical protein
LTERIKALDTSISRLAAKRHPDTIYLKQASGGGPITSLYFVLKVGNPGRLPGLMPEAPRTSGQSRESAGKMSVGPSYQGSVERNYVHERSESEFLFE